MAHTRTRPTLTLIPFPQHWVIRMPNFVKVDSKPFHPDTYIGPEHEDDFSGGTHERDMGIKLRVENTVRWRWTKDKDDQEVSPLVFFSFFSTP